MTKLIDVAQSWVDTPYKNHQKTKGVGVDCVRLIVGIGEEMGLDINIENYHLLPEGGGLLNECRKYLIEIPKDDAQIGDILVFKTSFNGIPRHLGIKSQKGIIHADDRVGKVVDIRLGYMGRLIVATFRMI